MNQHDYEVAKHIATTMLKFDIGFDNDGKVYMEIGGQKWQFKNETDAQAVEEIARIFNGINKCMWEVVNDKILSWVAKGRKNFN